MAWDEKGYLLRNYINVRTNPETPQDISETQQFFAYNPKGIKNKIIDIQWVRGRFNIQTKEMADTRFINARFFSTASYKYSGTKLGSHLACNPKPGFTPYADIPPAWNPVRNFGANRHTRSLTVGETYDNSLGAGEYTQGELSPMHNIDGFPMGRYYSEAIDDNQQLVYMTFGTKRFNGILDFLISSIDYGDVVVANTGRSPTFYRAGKMIGTGIAFMCFPLTTMLIWAIKVTTKLFAATTAFDYYYMAPTMHTYWAAVNSLITQFATELQIINPAFEPQTFTPTSEGEDIGVVARFDQDEMELLSNYLGHGILDPKTGYVDIWAIMARPQAMYRKFLENRRAELEQPVETGRSNAGLAPLTDVDGSLLGLPPGPVKVSNEDEQTRDDTTGDMLYNKSSWSEMNFDAYLNKSIRTTNGGQGLWAAEDNNNVASGEGNGDLSSQISSNPKYTDEETRYHATDGSVTDFTGQYAKDNFWSRFKSSMDATIHDAGESAIFAVDFTGSMSDSISNSTGDIETEGILKSVAAGANNLKFNFAGGNLGLGIDLSTIGGAVKDVLRGGLDGVTMGFSNVLSTIFGDAYVDLPKRWRDSEVQISETSYTMKLRSPYGDPYSILQNQIIPLAMILAGGLPLSTGKSSYTSPFLCSLSCQGVQNIQLGMITSISINRATSNLPFTQGRRPLGIDVTFKVTDFSNLITAPISSSIFTDVFRPTLDDRSPIGRYISTVVGRDIQTMKYRSLQVAQRIGQAKAKMRGVFSANRIGANVGFMLNGPLSIFTAQGNYTVALPQSGRR